MTRMKIGIVGTGAIAAKHAAAWQSIGCPIVACTNKTEDKGRAFAARFAAEFVATAEQLCRHPDVELVDVCTFPDYRLEPIQICAELGKPVQLQKPMAIHLAAAREIAETVARAGITVGVVSQRRFDKGSMFLKQAIGEKRLGGLLEVDFAVKWYRSPEYYARPVKGSWSTEGGGALINQAIHQIDLVQWLGGRVKEVYGNWRLGAMHRIESEDLVNAIVKFESGALGTMQASTALWPGYPERVEIHGTKGSAVLTGDRLTKWDVQDDNGEDAPIDGEATSGANDPMAISLEPFERQFRDLVSAHQEGREPLVGVREGFESLAVVEAIYESCRTGTAVQVEAGLESE
jgi:UDP-N-acetyl-2-amino-2-deoxyglucuronate dehydrogenase